jgi:hypothetical protein
MPRPPSGETSPLIRLWNIDLGIGKDTDLSSLHNDPRIAALVAHAQQVAVSRSAPAHSSN